MTLRSKLWRVVGVLYTLINFAGVGIAAVRGEWLHAAVHVGLLLLGAGVVWWLTQRGRGQSLPRVPQADERLDHLQQSVDAIALEVERIGEAQRFSVKLQAEREDAQHP